jgi:predicted unusual protein kinase regulating ubiquinone biosynthesis (AarF/ABC1/UbiB family)
VYRVLIQTKNGPTDVAVKVQRPNVLADIALDLYLVREFGVPFYQAVLARGGGTDLQALANEWGRGFIAELDYRTEAAKTMKFRQDMKDRNLNSVTAPRVLTDVSTEQVLITEWIDGERIDQSPADDIPRLCAVALNAYLVMLLELKSLHCDPHPVR